MKILLADPQALFREGLEMVLAQLGEEVKTAHAENFSQALASASAGLDLTLMDLRLPGLDGLSGLRALCHFRPETPVVGMSAADDPDLVRRALEAGAAAAIAQTMRGRDMIQVLRTVLSGQTFLPVPAVPQDLDPGARRSDLDANGLTPRQAEVLQLLAQGKSNKSIARALGLAEVTVKGHVTAILKTLHLDNRTQAGIAGAGLHAAAVPGVVPRAMTGAVPGELA